MRKLVQESLNEFFGPKKGKNPNMSRFNELKREEMVQSLIGANVIKVEYKNLAGEIVLYLDDKDINIAPNGGARPDFSINSAQWDSPKNDIEDIKGTIKDIKDDFYEVTFTFEEGLEFTVYDPTGGEGLDFWASAMDESLNEYEKPGTKKRKLEDGILGLYSSNVPDYKIGELKTRAAEAMQEEYDRGYHEGSADISSGLSMD